MLKILTFPHPNLKIIAKPVTEFNAELQLISNQMFAIMYHAQGIGLAATQVDIHQRIIVIDTSRNRDSPLVIINPTILTSSNPIQSKEGCLSFPNITVNVTRDNDITIGYYDLTGSQHELTTSGLLSICIQHEIDHLNGITFYDRLSSIRKSMIATKIKKLTQKFYANKE